VSVFTGGEVSQVGSRVELFEASTLPLIPGTGLPSASSCSLRRAGGGVFHHRTVQQRLVAHDVTYPVTTRPQRSQKRDSAPSS
jgi:hypothetical protein